MNKIAGKTVIWDFNEFSEWRGFVQTKDWDDKCLYRIMAIEEGTFGGQFEVWVPKRGEQGVWIRPIRGPIAKIFECLCAAKAACETHYARRHAD